MLLSWFYGKVTASRCNNYSLVWTLVLITTLFFFSRHPPNLIRVFAVRIKKAWVISYPLSAQRRLWSDWADAQAELSLRWVHTHFVGFVISWLSFTPVWSWNLDSCLKLRKYFNWKTKLRMIFLMNYLIKISLTSERFKLTPSVKRGNLIKISWIFEIANSSFTHITKHTYNKAYSMAKTLADFPSSSA